MRAVKTILPLLVIVLAAIAATFGVMTLFAAWKLGVFLRFAAGLLFICFGSVKFYRIDAFAHAFASYDIIGRKLPLYGYVYPILQVALGVLLTTGFWMPIVLVAAYTVTGIAAVGSLFAANQTRATLLRLPVAEVTFTESVTLLFLLLGMLGVVFF